MDILVNTENEEFETEFDNDYSPSVDRLRFVLIFLYCIKLWGFPTSFGPYIQFALGFVPVAFFILSGYLVLREKNRLLAIVRAIKRTAIVFVILAVIYFLFCLFYYKVLGVDMLPQLVSKRLWFDFIAMNIWPINLCGAIWYVQALLYTYIILYFIEKFKLMKFDYIIIIVCLLITLFTGEFSQVIGFYIFGYTYIPGCFLTLAVPYVLLGGILREKIDFFDNLKRYVYFIGFIIGIALIFFEPFVLFILRVPSNYDHLIGMPVAALSFIMLFIQSDPIYPEESFRLGLNRWEINFIFYLYVPLGAVVAVLLNSIGAKIFDAMNGFVGLISFAIAFLVALLLSFIRKKHFLH